MFRCGIFVCGALALFAVGVRGDTTTNDHSDASKDPFAIENSKDYIAAKSLSDLKTKDVTRLCSSTYPVFNDDNSKVGMSLREPLPKNSLVTRIDTGVSKWFVYRTKDDGSIDPRPVGEAVVPCDRVVGYQSKTEGALDKKVCRLGVNDAGEMEVKEVGADSAYYVKTAATTFDENGRQVSRWEVAKDYPANVNAPSGTQQQDSGEQKRISQSQGGEGAAGGYYKQQLNGYTFTVPNGYYYTETAPGSNVYRQLPKSSASDGQVQAESQQQQQVQQGYYQSYGPQGHFIQQSGYQYQQPQQYFHQQQGYQIHQRNC